MGPEESDYPVIAGADGIKLKTEKMVPEQLYHCVHEGKVFLFYKDQEGHLNCYEVGDPKAAEEIAKNPDDVENILKKYAERGEQSQS